jgi:hypothetical protein
MRIFWGILIGWAGAGLWAVDLTRVDQATEPVRPWADYFAQNNEYWARDLRVMAIVGALAGLLLALNGRWWAVAPVSAAAWFGADMLLDRYDVHGTVVVGAVASLLLTVAALAGRQRGPARNPRRVLLSAAFLAAASAPVAAATTSPTDSEATLTPLSGGVAALLAVAAIGCGLGAGDMTRRRYVAAAAAVPLAAGGVVALRLVGPAAQAIPIVVFFGGAFLGLIAVIGGAARPLQALTVGVLSQLVGGIVGALVLFATEPLAAMWTAAAGDPAVNPADEDVLVSVSGLVTAVVFGVFAFGLAQGRLPTRSALDRTWPIGRAVAGG